jgi:hypothetical protein
MTSVFDYIDAIIAYLDQPTVEREELLKLLGERTGGYLSIIEFRPAHEAFSYGQVLLYHPNEEISAVRLTVQAPLTAQSFIDRFGPGTRGSTNNINTHYRMHWLVGKAPGSLNQVTIHVSWEGLVQQLTMSRDRE